MSQQAIAFRCATPNDADKLAPFAARLFPLGGRPGANPAHLDAYIAAELTPQRLRQWIADPSARLVLAESNDDLIGYAMLLLERAHSQVQAQAPAEIRKFYLDPSAHGQGVANSLMGEILSLAHGRDVIWLTVYSENLRGIRFYERSGFRIVGSQDFWVGDDCQKDFLMRLDLPKGTR